MKHFIQKLSIVLAAALLIAAAPVTALAGKTLRQSGSEQAVSPSDAARIEDEEIPEDEEILDENEIPDEDEILEATPSDAEDEEIIPATPSDAEEVLDEKETDLDITGTWTLDGVTSYRFDGDGTGALLLPESEYAFTYRLEGEALTIDFESVRAHDGTYRAGMGGDGLILAGGEGTIGGTYEFTKVK